MIVAKPGLDGHDRGAKVVARALRDAGMEVVYTGIYQTPDSILRAVIRRTRRFSDSSSLSGAHMEYAKDLCKLLAASDRSDVLFPGQRRSTCRRTRRAWLGDVTEDASPAGRRHHLVHRPERAEPLGVIEVERGNLTRIYTRLGDGAKASTTIACRARK